MGVWNDRFTSTIAVRLALAWIAVAALFAGIAGAATPDAVALANRYETLRTQLAASAFGLPLVVDSGEVAGRVQGVIEGELAEPYAPIVTRLATPRAWCDVLMLHLNVKGCAAEGALVTVWSGRKHYEPIASAYAIRYTLRVAAARPDYFKAVLAADSGPLGTRDYEVVLEAMPIGAHTFVTVRYAFRPSAASRLATAAYLATSGSDKAGFTIVGYRADGRPEWIGGMRGIVERNAMRNFLALDAWTDAPAAEQRERRIRRMAALADRYPVQLFEMPAAEYIAMKLRETLESAQRERVASL